MFGALAGLIQEDRKRLGESIDALQQKVAIGKIKRDMESYLDTYGMDLSSENIRAHGKKTGNYDWKDALVHGVTEWKKGQSEGQRLRTPGSQLIDFQGEPVGEAQPFKEAATPAWFGKLSFAEKFPSIAKKYPKTFGMEKSIDEKLEDARKMGDLKLTQELERFKKEIAAGYKETPAQARTADLEAELRTKARLSKEGFIEKPGVARTKDEQVSIGLLKEKERLLTGRDTIAKRKLDIITKWQNNGVLSNDEKRFIGISNPLTGELTESAAIKNLSDLGLMHGLDPEEVARAQQFFMTQKRMGNDTKDALFATLDEIKDISIISKYKTPEELRDSDLPVSEKIRIGKKAWPTRFK